MRPATYLIDFEGAIPADARAEFAGFALVEHGHGGRLVGEFADQAALHGVLDRLNHLGLRLIEVSLHATDTPGLRTG